MNSRTFLNITGNILRYAIPSSIGSLLNLMQNTINLIFVGHLNDPKLLAAVGMGNMLISIIAIAPFLGLNSGLETLVSQGLGAGNYKQCGVYL